MSFTERYEKMEGCYVNSKVYVFMDTGPYIESQMHWKQVTKQTITQVDPVSGDSIGGIFTFDGVSFGKSTDCIYKECVKNVIQEFFHKTLSNAVILYGSSHIGKSRCMEALEKHYRRIFHRAINDIMVCVRSLKKSYGLLRMSCVDIYKEEVEDLFVTDLLNDTDAPQPSLKLGTDTNGSVVWLGARTPIITSKKGLQFLFEKGFTEHMRRGKKVRDRLGATHTIIRLVLESTPETEKFSKWPDADVFISYLDFVLVGGSDLLPTFTSVAERLSVAPRTKSLFSLYNFVTQVNTDKNELYDSRRSTLMQILHKMLFGRGHSVFVCICDPNDTHTHATLKFGMAAARLVQNPMRNKYPFHCSMMWMIISQAKENMTLLWQNKQMLEDHFESDRHRCPGRQKKDLSSPVFSELVEPLQKINFIGKWKPEYQRWEAGEVGTYYGKYDSIFIQAFNDEKQLNCPEMMKAEEDDEDDEGVPLYHVLTGSVKKHDTSEYYGGYIDHIRLKARRNKDDSLSFKNYVKGTLVIRSNWKVHSTHIITDHRLIDEAYLLKDSKPMKVYFPLNMLEPAKHIGCAADGYAHFHRLLWWIQHLRKVIGESKTENKITRFKCKIPDFIAPKEVFIDLYLTPYRRTVQRWKIKAVT
ncbi:uncharacterized protein [Cherax quadricarinatus]|uniref:uncharacterized protein isoform X2 n=1 Tax=Cherax quadricarinatus TaxID=27406 RepID=UPI00387E2153